MGMTPFYYGDLIMLDDNMLHAKILSINIVIIKIITAVIATITTVAIYKTNQCYGVMFSLPSIITIGLVILVGLIYALRVIRMKSAKPDENIHLL